MKKAQNKSGKINASLAAVLNGSKDTNYKNIIFIV